jgi:GH15 family glucan-1,4-alpha-glucosidase
MSDTHAGALLSREGCVDWLCFPRFDSGAWFAALRRFWFPDIRFAFRSRERSITSRW